MRRARQLWYFLRWAACDWIELVWHQAKLEVAVEEAAEALEPFAGAYGGAERYGWSWSARDGHSVDGLRAGLCARDFEEAQRVAGDLARLTQKKGAR